MGRIVYNVNTGEVTLDRCDSRAYKLPDGFDDWCVIGFCDFNSKSDKYHKFSDGVCRLNKIKKKHKKEILSVEEAKRLWLLYDFIEINSYQSAEEIERNIMRKQQ